MTKSTASSATTLKLSPSLKKRIAPLAERDGKSAHAWMIDALERQVELAALRESFLDDARSAADEVDAGGPLYAADEVHASLSSRATGKAAPRPRARKHLAR